MGQRLFGSVASGVGFVLLDASLRVLYANSEAVRILTFQATRPTRQELDRCLTTKIRAELESCRPSPGQPSLTELPSGRRRYLCRAFELGPESQSTFTTASVQPSIAAFIERGRRAIELARVGAQYHLTPREREAMALLLYDLTSKQIARRMRISPNTVKVFLRAIMLKMGVSTHSGIVGKILASALDTPAPGRDGSGFLAPWDVAASSLSAAPGVPRGRQRRVRARVVK